MTKVYEEQCEITYFISDGEFTKIGRTIQHILYERLAQLQTGNARPLCIEYIIHGNREGFFHKLFQECKVNNEWFLLPSDYDFAIKNVCTVNNWGLQEFHNYVPKNFFSFSLFSSLLKRENLSLCRGNE